MSKDCNCCAGPECIFESGWYKDDEISKLRKENERLREENRILRAYKKILDEEYCHAPLGRAYIERRVKEMLEDPE